MLYIARSVRAVITKLLMIKMGFDKNLYKFFEIFIRKLYCKIINKSSKILNI